VAIARAVLLDDRQAFAPPPALVRRAPRVVDGEPALRALLDDVRMGAPVPA
jgi:hypothetical protein